MRGMQMQAASALVSVAMGGVAWLWLAAPACKPWTLQWFSNAVATGLDAASAIAPSVTSASQEGCWSMHTVAKSLFKRPTPCDRVRHQCAYCFVIT